MSAIQALREFIKERLAAAAGEIFTVFERVIVRHEEEIDRQRKLLQLSYKPQIKLNRTESPQQHVGNQKTSSSLEQEEHEAPHVKEENLVEMTVTDGESENSLDSVRNFTTQRLNAAAGEIFTEFEQTIVQYKKEIDRQHRWLEITWKPQIKLYRTELTQHRDCTEEQVFKLETNYSLEQRESEPPQIKEEEEEPGLLQFKEEEEEPGLLQFKEEKEEPGLLQFKKDQEELSTNQEGEQLILKFESDTFKVPSIQEQRYLSEPEEVLNTEQFLSNDSEIHDVKKQINSESTRTAELKKISIFQSDHVVNFPVSESLAECEKLLHEETCGKIVRKKHKSCQNLRSVTDKKVVCEICGKSYNRHSKLLMHMRSHTGEYSCEICGRSFREERKMLNHMRIHTGTKPFSCKICGNSFSQPCHLINHMRTHTGETPYSCKICGKSFSVRCTLSRHMRIHTGEKPYSCETCGKCFSVQSNMLVHMRTHSGEKPFSCKICGKSFGRHCTLLRHMKIHKEMNQ